MDPTVITIAAGVAGLGIGGVLGALRGHTKAEDLRDLIELKDEVIADKSAQVLGANRDLADLDRRCVTLRAEKRSLAQQLDSAHAEVNRLRPHAERGMRAANQRQAALAKATEANRARAAAKRAAAN